MRRTILASSVVLAAIVAGCGSEGAGSRDSLTIVTDATFPPFHFIGEDGEPTGFDIELARRMATRAGYEAVIAVKPYDELHAGLAAGAHDLVAATTGVTPEREETYQFTRPYFETSQVALVRSGEGEPGTLIELAGRNVGASGSGTAARAMRSLVDATPIELTEEGPAPLENGTVDAIVVDEFDAVAMARTSGGSLRVLSEPIASERYAFVLARDRPELQRELDEALAALES